MTDSKQGGEMSREERELHFAWYCATKEIIDHWVAPNMYPQARAMLDLAYKAALNGTVPTSLSLPPKD